MILGEKDVKFKRYDQGPQGLEWCCSNTPLDYDHYLSEKYGAKIYLKKENAQRVRSLKFVVPIMPFPSSARKSVNVE